MSIIAGKYLANGAHHEGLGTDQLVVGGVVHNVEDASTAGDLKRKANVSTWSSVDAAAVEMQSVEHSENVTSVRMQETSRRWNAPTPSPKRSFHAQDEGPYISCVLLAREQSSRA
eukprot:1312066-Rhodomonas_salina.1